MIPKLKDDFWSASAFQEKRKAELKSRLAQMKSARAMALGITSIKSHPSFGQYVKAVGDLRDVYVQEVVKSDNLARVRQAQGSVRAFDEILKLFASAEESEQALAKEIGKVQNDLRSIGQSAIGVMQ